MDKKKTISRMLSGWNSFAFDLGVLLLVVHRGWVVVMVRVHMLLFWGKDYREDDTSFNP